MKKLSYKDIVSGEVFTSVPHYIAKHIAILIILPIQRLPLTANVFTTLSVGIAFLGIATLFVFESKIVFLLLLFISHIFDNVDGVWARMHHQVSAFGKFYDGFMDAVKYYAIDLALIIFFLEFIQQYIPDTRLFLFFLATYFIIKGLFYVSFTKEASFPGMRIFIPANPTEKYFVIFPLIVFFEGALLLYFALTYSMQLMYIFIFLWNRSQSVEQQ